MQKREKIFKAEIEPLLTYMRSIEIKLQEACGPIVAIEMRMRLIGQFSEPVRDKIETRQSIESRTPNPKIHLQTNIGSAIFVF
jgi:hypothetical protein